MDLNKFYEDFKKDPYTTRVTLIQEAIKELKDTLIKYKVFDNGTFNSKDLLDLLQRPNYEEIFEWLGWPDFQDNGIFYECIDIACDTLLQAYQYKPLNYLSKYGNDIKNLDNK